MLIMRLLLLLAVLSIGGSVILWQLTGNVRYKAWAWKAARATVVRMSGTKPVRRTLSSKRNRLRSTPWVEPVIVKVAAGILALIWG